MPINTSGCKLFCRAGCGNTELPAGYETAQFGAQPSGFQHIPGHAFLRAMRSSLHSGVERDEDRVVCPGDISKGSATVSAR